MKKDQRRQLARLRSSQPKKRPNTMMSKYGTHFLKHTKEQQHVKDKYITENNKHRGDNRIIPPRKFNAFGSFNDEGANNSFVKREYEGYPLKLGKVSNIFDGNPSLTERKFVPNDKEVVFNRYSISTEKFLDIS